MSDAPEKIWAGKPPYDNEWWTGEWSIHANDCYEPAVEFTRTDIAEAAKAAAHAAGVAEGMERARKIAVGQLKNTWPDLTEREMGALNVLLAICAAIPKAEGAE